MKILCVIDNLSTGGAQRQIVNLARGLRRRGHEVAMFRYAEGDLLAPYLAKESIPVHTRLKKSRFSSNAVRGLRRLIDEGGYRAVVSFLNTPNFYAIAASRLSRTRPAVVVSERFCDVSGQVGRLEMAVRRLYRLADRIVVNSRHQNANFTRRYPWMKGRLVTIYNGYDLDEFSPPAAEPEGPGLGILAIASVTRYKNGLCLVRALDVLAREHGLRPAVDWAGKRARDGDAGEYLAAMEGELGKAGLGDQWHWLDQRTDIAELLRRHDLLVHPSYGEGLPNVVCEAMASGRPVIVSNVLDHPYLVRDGVNGYLFDPQDPRDLARQIQRFAGLAKPERRRMGESGRAWAEENLSMERYVGDFEKIILEAAGRRG